MSKEKKVWEITFKDDKICVISKSIKLAIDKAVKEYKEVFGVNNSKEIIEVEFVCDVID